MPPDAMTRTDTPKIALRPIAVVDVHDGDTVTVRAEMNAIFPDYLPHCWQPHVRIAHCNAAELDTPEGIECRAVVAKLLIDMPPIELLVYGRDKYGRLLGDLVLPGTATALLSDFVLKQPGSKLMALSQLMPPRRQPHHEDLPRAVPRRVTDRTEDRHQGLSDPLG